jgi:hypothetical protein
VSKGVNIFPRGQSSPLGPSSDENWPLSFRQPKRVPANLLRKCDEKTFWNRLREKKKLVDKISNSFWARRNRTNETRFNLSKSGDLLVFRNSERAQRQGDQMCLQENRPTCRPTHLSSVKINR